MPKQVFGKIKTQNYHKAQMQYWSTIKKKLQIIITSLRTCFDASMSWVQIEEWEALKDCNKDKTYIQSFRLGTTGSFPKNWTREQQNVILSQTHKSITKLLKKKEKKKKKNHKPTTYRQQRSLKLIKHSLKINLIKKIQVFHFFSWVDMSVTAGAKQPSGSVMNNKENLRESEEWVEVCDCDCVIFSSFLAGKKIGLTPVCPIGN